MEQPVYYLFVYGSLRSGFHHPAYQYISDYFTLIGEASTPGVLYDMGDYPAALPSEAARIKGELYKINNEEEFDYAIAQLDDYEGVMAEEGETPLYRRALTTVFIGGQTQEAWIYWYNGDIAGRQQVENGDVLEFWKQKNNPS